MERITAVGTPYAQWNPQRARIYLGPHRRPWVSYGILGLTVAVFVAQQASAWFLGRDWVAYWLMKWPAAYIVLRGEWWRLWTAALVHANIFHIGFNMYALYLYGPLLEGLLGRGWFAVFYLTAALWGNALSAVAAAYPSLGASTAVFGLFAGLWFLARRHEDVLGLWGARLRQTMWGLIVFNILYGALMPNIDNWGHGGGALGGLLFMLLAGPRWQLRPYPFERLSEQEKAAFFLHRTMPLELYSRQPWYWRLVGVAVLWALALGMVYWLGWRRVPGLF